MIFTLAIVGGGLLLWLLLASLPVRSRDVRVRYLSLLSLASAIGIAWPWIRVFATHDTNDHFDIALVLTAVLLPGGLVSVIRLLTTHPPN